MLGKPIRANVVLAAAILVAGLAAAPNGVLAAGNTPATRTAGDNPAASADHPTNPAAELVIRSLSMLGVNYKWGGNSPDTGLDCSGLVRFVYEETLGKVLPRRSVEMSREGESVDRHELKPGDLVFFNTLRRAFSHVGIYIGNNQFVHAPSRGKQVGSNRSRAATGPSASTARAGCWPRTRSGLRSPSSGRASRCPRSSGPASEPLRRRRPGRPSGRIRLAVPPSRLTRGIESARCAAGPRQRPRSFPRSFPRSSSSTFAPIPVLVLVFVRLVLRIFLVCIKLPLTLQRTEGT